MPHNYCCAKLRDGIKNAKTQIKRRDKAPAVPDNGDIKHLALNGITQDTLSRALALSHFWFGSKTIPHGKSSLKVDHVNTQLGKHGGCFLRVPSRRASSLLGEIGEREGPIQLIYKFTSRMLQIGFCISQIERMSSGNGKSFGINFSSVIHLGQALMAVIISFGLEHY